MRESVRILLVQEEGPGRDADEALFLQAGMEVSKAGTAAEARMLWQELPPDLVLLERELPDLDGLRLLESFRGGEDDFTPVMMASRDPDSAARVQGLQQGADDYLIRPCDPAELLARARTLLRLKRSHERIRAVQRELEAMAVSDPLTGLFNRRALHDRLKQEFERVGRYRQPLAMAMVDLDGFKPINDQHGHLFGDRVLREVAGAITRSVRGLDIGARYGGDEFALIMPQTEAVGAMRVCERLLRNIAAVRVPGDDGYVAQITVSLGLAFYPAEGINAPEDLLRAADDALYRAKRTGRNKFCAVRSADAA